MMDGINKFSLWPFDNMCSLFCEQHKFFWDVKGDTDTELVDLMQLHVVSSSGPLYLYKQQIGKG